MSDSLSGAPNIFVLLFHLSNLAAFLAFLLRDQLQLRILMAVSLFLQGLYYLSVPGGPIVDPLFWKVVSFLANGVMIALVFTDRLDFGIPSDLRPLYQRIGVLSPGQFRRLALSCIRVGGAGQTILTEGQRPGKLYYLLKGEAHIVKNRQTAAIQSGTFLGEIAFLDNGPATATVVLPRGSFAVAWEHDTLRKLLEKENGLDIAMRGFFNQDLSRKVAKSVPIAPPVKPQDVPSVE